jgi:NAD-dependent deacetylase
VRPWLGSAARCELFGDDLAELHGTLKSGVCVDCGRNYGGSEVATRIAAADDGVPRCDCGYPVKPGVVLFGELLPVDEHRRAERLALDADYFLCLGFSAWR